MGSDYWNPNLRLSDADLRGWHEHLARGFAGSGMPNPHPTGNMQVPLSERV